MFRPIPAIIALLLAAGGAVAVSSAIEGNARSTSQTAPTIAQGSPPAAKQSGMGWLQDLDLTPDQMQKIQSIRSQYQDSLMRQKQAARQAQQELRSQMASDASTDQIREKYRQVQTLRQQVADTQFNSMLEMRQVLTPQQRQKFAERMERHRGNFKMRS